MDDTNPISISALQHYAYCPRQCALIHVEQAFADNVHTARGQAVHRLVDTPGYEFKAGIKVERAPLDPINALLSFLYSMLMNDCRSALESVGLDPQLGFLHVVRPGRAALALDLMEEFRPYLADRLALTLLNRNQLSPEDFDYREGGAVLLNERGRKAVVVAYQERKQEELRHPLLDTKTSIALLPLLQARFMARTLRGEMKSYLPFVTR